jgi:hypothetical protein
MNNGKHGRLRFSLVEIGNLPLFGLRHCSILGFFTLDRPISKIPRTLARQNIEPLDVLSYVVE